MQTANHEPQDQTQDRKKKLLTFAYYLSFIALGLISGALGPAVPSFAENTSTALSQVSSLFVFSSLGYISGSIISGYLYNNLAGNKVLMISIILLGLGVASLPVINTLWMLLLVIYLVGIMQSITDVGGNTLLVWTHGSKVAPYMNGLHFFFGFGSFIAPLIIAQSLKINLSIKPAFWLMALLIFLPIFFLFQLASPANPHKQDLKSVELTPVNKKKRKMTLLVILYFMGFTGAEITFGNWIYTHGLKTAFLNVETAAYLTSVFWGTVLAGRLLGIALAKKYTCLQFIWFNLIGGVTSLLLMLAFSDSAAILWIGTVAFGLSIATGFPSGINLAEDLNLVTARITSLIFVASSISVMISPWIVGQFIERDGSQILFVVVLANIIWASLMILGIDRGKKQIRDKTISDQETI